MLTFVLGVITGLAVREIADYLPASSHFSRATLRWSSGCPSASEKPSARRQRLNLPNDRQDVGRKLAPAWALRAAPMHLTAPIELRRTQSF